MTDRERAVAEMYLAGRPLREVGEAFGVNRLLRCPRYAGPETEAT